MTWEEFEEKYLPYLVDKIRLAEVSGLERDELVEQVAVDTYLILTDPEIAAMWDGAVIGG